MKPLFTSAPSKIAIIRLSAIGDVANAIAMVQQIQQTWPMAEITWIVGKTEAQLVSLLPNIRIVVLDKKAGWKGVFSVWKQLRKERFDALLLIQTSLRAGILSLGIKANYKIGFDRHRAREGHQLFITHAVPESGKPHLLDGFLNLAHFIGVPKPSAQWNIPIPDSALSQVEQWLDPTKKNIAICHCSSKPEKDWRISAYSEVIDYLIGKDVNVILIGSPSLKEVQMAEAIIAQSQYPDRIKNSTGKTTLVELLALIKRVDLVLSPDSGPAHLAVTQNTPVVSLFAIHNPLCTGPYNNLDGVVSVYEENIVAQYHKTSQELPWATRVRGSHIMQQITPSMVIHKINQIVSLDNSTSL